MHGEIVLLPMSTLLRVVFLWNPGCGIFFDLQFATCGAVKEWFKAWCGLVVRKRIWAAEALKKIRQMCTNDPSNFLPQNCDATISTLIFYYYDNVIHKQIHIFFAQCFGTYLWVYLPARGTREHWFFCLSLFGPVPF